MYYDQKESGKRIAELRRVKGYTQEELAEQLNIATNSISNIERGVRGISIDLLVELVCVFNVSTDYILLGKDLRNDEVKKDLQKVISLMMSLERKL